MSNKINCGFLMKNKKQRDDRDPGYQGSVNVAGVDYWLSAWVNTSKAGEKFFSLRVKQKDTPVAAPAAKAEPAMPEEEEDVPF